MLIADHHFGFSSHYINPASIISGSAETPMCCYFLLMARSVSMNGIRVAKTTSIFVKTFSICLFLIYTAMTNAKPSVAVNTTSLTNASCIGPCYIANYCGVSIHTFGPVQTVTTATLIPYVTILSNGTNATSISTRSANITLTPNSTYFSASHPLASVVSGFTFTYPSYAIEYYNIQGYVYTMTSVKNQSTCTLDNVRLPFLAASNTFFAATTLPLHDAVASESPYIPPQVIDNLNKIPEVAATFHTSNINSCINAFAPQLPPCKILRPRPAVPVAEVKVEALTTTAVAVATGEPVVVSAGAAAQVKSPAASTMLSQAQLPSKDNNTDVAGVQFANQPSQPELPSPGGQAKPSQETFESSLYQSPHPTQGDTTQVSQHPALSLAQISTTAQPEGTQMQQGSRSLPTQLPVTGQSEPAQPVSLVAEGSTVPLYTAVLTISAGYKVSVLTPGSYTGFVTSAQSLASGNAVTVNGIAISLPISGSVVIVGNSTIGLGATKIITAGRQALTFLPDPSFGSAMGGQTIVPVQASTINRVPVSLLSSGSSFVLDASTTQPGTIELDTVASQTFTLTAGSSSRLIINPQPYTPGQDITINSISISVPPSDSLVVIGTSTIPLGPGTERTPSIGSQALTIAEGASSALVVNGQTITPGEGEVIDGVTVSLPLSGTAATVDTSSVGLGSLSSSGLDFGPTSTGTPTATGNLTVVGSTGGASSLKGTVDGWMIWMIGILVTYWMASS